MTRFKIELAAIESGTYKQDDKKARETAKSYCFGLFRSVALCIKARRENSVKGEKKLGINFFVTIGPSKACSIKVVYVPVHLMGC